MKILIKFEKIKRYVPTFWYKIESELKRETYKGEYRNCIWSCEISWLGAWFTFKIFGGPVEKSI